MSATVEDDNESLPQEYKRVEHTLTVEVGEGSVIRSEDDDQDGDHLNQYMTTPRYARRGSEMSPQSGGGVPHLSGNMSSTSASGRRFGSLTQALRPINSSPAQDASLQGGTPPDSPASGKQQLKKKNLHVQSSTKLQDKQNAALLALRTTISTQANIMTNQRITILKQRDMLGKNSTVQVRSKNQEIELQQEVQRKRCDRLEDEQSMLTSVMDHYHVEMLRFQQENETLREKQRLQEDYIQQREQTHTKALQDKEDEYGVMCMEYERKITEIQERENQGNLAAADIVQKLQIGVRTLTSENEGLLARLQRPQLALGLLSQPPVTIHLSNISSNAQHNFRQALDSINTNTRLQVQQQGVSIQGIKCGSGNNRASMSGRGKRPDQKGPEPAVDTSASRYTRHSKYALMKPSEDVLPEIYRKQKMNNAAAIMTSTATTTTTTTAITTTTTTTPPVVAVTHSHHPSSVVLAKSFELTQQRQPVSVTAPNSQLQVTIEASQAVNVPRQPTTGTWHKAQEQLNIGVPVIHEDKHSRRTELMSTRSVDLRKKMALYPNMRFSILMQAIELMVQERQKELTNRRRKREMKKQMQADSQIQQQGIELGLRKTAINTLSRPTSVTVHRSNTPSLSLSSQSSTPVLQPASSPTFSSAFHSLQLVQEE